MLKFQIFKMLIAESFGNLMGPLQIAMLLDKKLCFKSFWSQSKKTYNNLPQHPTEALIWMSSWAKP
jgi:hypothetical protein